MPGILILIDSLINNLPYSDRYFNTDWQFEMFKRGKSFLVYISKYGFLISEPYVVGTHCNCLIEAIPMCTYNRCPFNIHHTGFPQTSQLLFMFQCNGHVELNTFLCSLACTSMTITSSQFILLTTYL